MSGGLYTGRGRRTAGQDWGKGGGVVVNLLSMLFGVFCMVDGVLTDGLLAQMP